MDIKTINPSTEEELQSYALLTGEQINLFIEAAHTSYQIWRTTDFLYRKKLILNLANALRARKKEFSTLISTEMGKPITAGEAEIEKCAWVCEHYAKHAKGYLLPNDIKTNLYKTMICYLPLGIIFGIMPWNFPFWQVFRFAAPTIMAGNAVILKHAPNTTGCGNAIAQLFLEEGFPEYLFQHFVIDNDLASQVIAHDKISAVTLTGSQQAGRIVAANASKHLKKTVLELGGNDPYIILADADIELAAKSVVTSRLNNSGQVCIAAKRTIVVKDIIDTVITCILKNISTYKIGNPLDANTDLGPLAREDLRDTLHKQVQDSIRAGATLLKGGKLPSGKGYYYPPTVLTNVMPGMPAFDEELFGPVISIISAEDEKHAIQLANKSQYGLGAAIFTQNIERGEYLATNEIEAGACMVNGFLSSDPRVPFGGIKHSGYGRELSREGILEFVNIKTVGVEK